MQTQRQALPDRPRLSAHLRVIYALFVCFSLAEARPARAAEVEITVDISESPNHRDKQTLRGLVRTACRKACDPQAAVAARVVEALADLFPVHDFAPADPAKPRPYRLHVVLSSPDPTVQSTSIELRLLDRRRSAEVPLGKLRLPFVGPEKTRKIFPPLLDRIEEVLLECWTDIQKGLIRELPIQRLPSAAALASTRPASGTWPAHTFIDTRIDATELVPTRTTSTIFSGSFVFMLRWPGDTSAPVYFMMCDAQLIRGPVIQYVDPDAATRLPGCIDDALGRKHTGDLPATEVALYLGGLRR